MTVKMIYILNDILANAHFAMSFNKENTLGFAKWSNRINPSVWTLQVPHKHNEFLC